MADRERVACVVASGAPPAAGLDQLLTRLREAGWTTCLALTDAASSFVSPDELRPFVDLPVRTEYKTPGGPDVWPDASVFIVCPATFNTINKLAVGIADTFVASLLAEALGGGVRMVIVPCLKATLARHAAFAGHLELLRASGATVLWDPEKYPSPEIVPWVEIVDAVGSPTAPTGTSTSA